MRSRWAAAQSTVWSFGVVVFSPFFDQDLFILRGVPVYIRSDNGPEFIAEAVRSLARGLTGTASASLFHLALRHPTFTGV